MPKEVSLFTIINGILQYNKSFKPTLFDLLPRERFSILAVLADIILINLFLLLFDKITLAGFISVVSSIVIMLLFVIIAFYINGKELEDAREDLAKARAYNRERGLFDAEKEAHISRIEMELKGLRARVKSHKDSVEVLVVENNNLKRTCELLKKEQLELAREIDKEFNNNDDAVSKVLLQENEQLKNQNEQLKKLVEIQKIRNDDLVRKQKQYRFDPENEWMAYIPYAVGDSLEDVKKAYRCLAKAMHPDSGEGNEEKMRKINDAFEKAKLWFVSKNEP